jgi:hypothetical protein
MKRTENIREYSRKAQKTSAGIIEQQNRRNAYIKQTSAMTRMRLIRSEQETGISQR